MIVYGLWFFIALCQSVGIMAAVYTRSSVTTWYPTLRKPSFNPPNWLFAPAWITLYLLMGIAGHFIWQQGQGGADVRLALGLFGVQLFFNGIWSILFFGWRKPLWALYDIALLWLSIVLCIAVFWKIHPSVSLLFVPYLAWVSFASLLNFKIVELNKGDA